MQSYELSHTPKEALLYSSCTFRVGESSTSAPFTILDISLSLLIKYRKCTHTHTKTIKSASWRSSSELQHTHTHLFHLVQSPYVPALWYAKHSVNIIQCMVTVTMAAWQQNSARPLKHGTVVLFNIWLCVSTACFYHIILSQQQKTSRRRPCRRSCAAERSPAVAMFWSYRTTTTKDKMLVGNSLPSVQSHTLGHMGAEQMQFCQELVCFFKKWN